jgi:D-beta-D-heptose 7-phosphate kinase/D-beta-D-heptose 1-phosphate adenosyltransferase
MKKIRWVAVSGGFDPIHIGHVRMLKAARALGGKLVIILNNDHWLKNKKGFVFMPEKERAELLRAFPFVDKVVITSHQARDTDRSVSKELAKLKPAIFANGGDRKTSNVPEVTLCRKLGIEMRDSVGRGGKVQSSSWMIRDAVKGIVRSVRPWGAFYQWDQGKGWNLKTLTVKPGKRLSLQYHHHREEWWMLVEGDATSTTIQKGRAIRTPLKKGVFFKVPRGTPHRIESREGGAIIEIAFGKFDENDIVRLEDDFGRTSL